METVKNVINQWCLQKMLKNSQNQQKRQKQQFCIFRVGLGRDFGQNVSFSRSENGSIKVVVLDNPVFWVSDCIGKKPGERW